MESIRLVLPPPGTPPPRWIRRTSSPMRTEGGPYADPPDAPPDAIPPETEQPDPLEPPEMQEPPEPSEPPEPPEPPEPELLSSPVPVPPTPVIPPRAKHGPRAGTKAALDSLPMAVRRSVTVADELAFSTLEHEVGGRQALAAALAGADVNVDEAQIVGMLADPRNDPVSLAMLCSYGRLSLHRLLKLFDSVVFVKGQLKARAKIAAALPDVAAAVMEDAIPGDRVCPACDGFQTIEVKSVDSTGAPTGATERVKCPTCYGLGTVRHIPETDIRKLALEIGGLTPKSHPSHTGAKTMIVNAPGGNGFGAGGSFDELMTRLDGALYGGGRERTRRGKGQLNAVADPPVEAAVDDRTDRPGAPARVPAGDGTGVLPAGGPGV